MKRFAMLVLASVLFAGWIGWLVYLAATKSRPVVLSRPQLLDSALVVIARVDDPHKEVVVEEVYAWRPPIKPPAVRSTLAIKYLDHCRRLPRDDEAEADVPPDWKGPGLYILPLRKKLEGSGYEVVPIPESPGFHRPLPSVGTQVVTAEGQGRVLERPGHNVLVQFEDGLRRSVLADEILWLRIYPAMEETRAQLEAIKPPGASP